MAVERKEASGLRDAEWQQRRRPAPLLPHIPRHWSQRSHKWLLTLTVNGYKKTPGFPLCDPISIAQGVC